MGRNCGGPKPLDVARQKQDVSRHPEETQVQQVTGMFIAYALLLLCALHRVVSQPPPQPPVVGPGFPGGFLGGFGGGNFGGGSGQEEQCTVFCMLINSCTDPLIVQQCYRFCKRLCDD
ncbi:hypothetical protein Btru_044069 [Bulinus truncatus]|nr:hypothetical protein Btru_044069 [Bulinus truncatus]